MTNERKTMGKLPDIDALVEDLSPVRAIRLRDGMGLTLLLGLAAIAFVIFWLEIRGDIAAGTPNGMFFVRAGVLLATGLATAWAAISMARPSVGLQAGSTKRRPAMWQAVLLLAAIVPVAAALRFFAYQPDAEVFAPSQGVLCLGFSGSMALVIGSGMTLWLRQGAPTDPERAGWLVGIAAGSFGALAWGFHCPFNSLIYIGTWYSLAVVMCGVVGRIVVPRLIRW